MPVIDPETVKELQAEVNEMLGEIAKVNKVVLPENDPVAVLLTAMQYISQCYAKSTDETVSALKKKLQEEMSIAREEWYKQVNEAAARTVDTVLDKAVQGATKSLIMAQQEAFTKQTSEQMIGIITDGVSKEIEKTEKKKFRWLMFATIASATASALSLITLALVIAK